MAGGAAGHEAPLLLSTRVRGLHDPGREAVEGADGSEHGQVLTPRDHAAGTHSGAGEPDQSVHHLVHDRDARAGDKNGLGGLARRMELHAVGSHDAGRSIGAKDGKPVSGVSTTGS